MGPEGGSRGGAVIAEGTPEQIAAHPDSYTGMFLKPILDGRSVPVGAAQPELVAPPAAAASKKTTQRVPAQKTSVQKTPAQKTPAKKVAAGRSTGPRVPASKAS
jgi:excinuclease ABC subunit A